MKHYFLTNWFRFKLHLYEKSQYLCLLNGSNVAIHTMSPSNSRRDEASLFYAHNAECFQFVYSNTGYITVLRKQQKLKHYFTANT